MKEAKTDDVARLVVARARVDITLFAQQTLPGTFRLPFAGFHHRLFDWHRTMAKGSLPRRAGKRFALAAPRGSAKSSIVSFLLVLHDLYYGREKYIILISATQRQAQLRLKALRQELSPNTVMANWFRSRGKRPIKITSSRNVIQIGNARVEAFGAGSEMRGVSYNSWRPTKIILDDTESSAAATSVRRRTALKEWFGEVVENLGDTYTHLLAIGTILHRESLLSMLLDRPDFSSQRLRSIIEEPSASPLWDEWRQTMTNQGLENRRELARSFFEEHHNQMETGARVLWPEHEDYETLRAQRLLQGRRFFEQEKQNEPPGAEESLFASTPYSRAVRDGDDWIVTAATRDGGASKVSRSYQQADLRVFAYHDAALGKGRAQKKGDFAALAVVGVANDGTMILMEIWIKRSPPTEQISAIFETHRRLDFEQIGIEGTGFQELLILPIKEEQQRRQGDDGERELPMTVIKPTRKKITRIAALEPLLNCGRLALSEDLPDEFWRELQDFPHVQHDDALDASAGAVELAMKSVRSEDASAKFDSIKKNKPSRSW